ncbi:hypothetical protein NBRC116493_35830 [Aurantivibrio infirmus]
MDSPWKSTLIVLAICVFISANTFSENRYFQARGNINQTFYSLNDACEAIAASSAIQRRVGNTYPYEYVTVYWENVFYLPAYDMLTIHFCYGDQVYLDHGISNIGFKIYGYVASYECGSGPEPFLAGGCKKSLNTGPTPNNTCRPINIATGNKYFNQIEGHTGISFARHYNSVTGLWDFSYNQELIFDIDSVVYFKDNGKQIRFLIDGDNFIPPSQSHESLTFDGSVYTLTFADNRYETYSETGRLLSIADNYGELIGISYIANQIVVSQNDKSLTLTKNTDGSFASAEFSDGIVINYEYITIGGVSVLSTVTYSDDSTRQYLYEDTNFPTYITGIIDENGNRISSVIYDTQGRAISSEKGPLNSGVERTQVQYNVDGSRTLTNDLGKQSTYQLTQINDEYKITQVEGHQSANCIAAIQNYTYYPSGLLETKTDWEGNTTSYQYNARNLEISRAEAVGTPQERTITTEWHPTFNLRTKIIEPGKETIFTYDAGGRLLSQTSDALP